MHDAEADVFAVQAFEGGAVTDHETLTDAGVGDVPGGQAGLLDFQEEKVGAPSCASSMKPDGGILYMKSEDERRFPILDILFNLFIIWQNIHYRHTAK